MESIITNINFYVNRLREDYILRKEQRRYLETYSTDYNHLKMKENFDIVLDNIEKLKNIFNLKSVPEIVIFIGYLIHCGALSEKGKYEYKTYNVDIFEYMNDKLNYALKIFSGFGCCRHTVCFVKIALDRLGIDNEIVETFTANDDYNLNEIRLFLNNYHKKRVKSNHVVNFVKDSEDEYFFDLADNHTGLYYGKDQFLYCFFEKTNIAFPLYNYSFWESNKHDYQNVRPLTLEEQEKIAFSIDKTLELFNQNDSLFKEFYFQNLLSYKEINSAYKEIYEREKRLRLIGK